MLGRDPVRISRMSLVQLFSGYINQAEIEIESDGFLPRLDVTNKAAAELLNDMLDYWSEANLIKNDTKVRVLYSEEGYV